MFRPVFVEHTWKSQEFCKFAKRAKWDTINTAGSWSNANRTLLPSKKIQRIPLAKKAIDMADF